ncbi:hypothetical protein AT00_05435 [Pseudoalteromonas lipolytica SCSIO 04301]|jgi:5-methylcytosine-specific restriction endonuclease McrA|uniref:hypothetical protein n=1 Tax=Pseudoalteromonas lipolytica TaxID=570156 RepID=UPI000451ED17|nr:hypothetical protein [Pseudoalteromonas lipolytica]EWH07135.1 hypothetical protein AT00_05435 [Pseudoalteromonas lipolytica SCSIO 04301]
MLKIKSSEEDSFSFYQEIVKSKRNTPNKPDIKEQLEAIKDSQALHYEEFDKAFQLNSLETINEKKNPEVVKAYLQSLYNYRHTKIQALKNSLTKHPYYKEHILNTCQNCTINEVDSMDHILGQTSYSELSVHPKNLFPCCTACNRKKSDSFTDDDGNRLFLNLFLDELPESQYLKVSFDLNWMPTFHLIKPNDITDNFFNLISSHYEKLDLLARFSRNSSDIISSLRAVIRSYKDTDINIEDKINEQCDEMGMFLGYNHRKVVIYRELASSEDFIKQCFA